MVVNKVELTSLNKESIPALYKFKVVTRRRRSVLLNKSRKAVNVVQVGACSRSKLSIECFSVENPP